jgi:hypothetical protein
MACDWNMTSLFLIVSARTTASVTCRTWVIPWHSHYYRQILPQRADTKNKEGSDAAFE